MATHVSLDVNGVRVNLYTKTFCERKGIENYWKVAGVGDARYTGGTQELVCTTVLGVGELVQLAGITDTFDYAVPQDWLDDMRRRGSTDHFIWVYPKGSLFGEPMSHTTLWDKAKHNVFNAFLQQKKSLEI